MEPSHITLVISLVTASVSIGTCLIARSQMKIASAKIKLDLYNKRFSVYATTLDYYQSAFGKGHQDMTLPAAAFIKAYRESLFLFDKSDGIHETLGRIQKSGAAISVKKQANADMDYPMKYDSESMRLLHERSVAGYSQFADDLPILEKQLVKYLQFTDVSGWRFYERKRSRRIETEPEKTLN